MRSRLWFILAVAVMTIVAAAAHAQSSDDDRYSIMRLEPGTKQPMPSEPKSFEPWLAPKYRSPRGTKQHVTVPRPQPAPSRPHSDVPPPIYVPETGRLLPNLPALPGAGLSGAETGQDRALRCAHQAGVYGQAAGNRDAYIGSCINQ